MIHKISYTVETECYEDLLDDDSAATVACCLKAEKGMCN